MSRSNPTADRVSPTERYFRWAGGAGKVEYYDKGLGETVAEKFPFLFLVLDQLSTVVGYSEREGGFWANEIRDTRSEELIVRSKNGVMYEGLYRDMNLNGAKFATSMYIAFKDEGGTLQIGNIKFAGAALSGWIDFAKKVNLNKVAVAITGSKSDKKGQVTFERPLFASVEVDEATEAQAIELDKALQEYLASRPTTSARPSEDVARGQARQDDEDAEDAVIEAVEQQGDLNLGSIKF